MSIFKIAVEAVGLAACLVFLDSGVFASELQGVNFPESASVQGRTLYLNGVGVRTKTIFKVHVYVAGLYVGAPSRDGDAILGSHGPKSIRMVFLRDAGAKQIVSGWNEGFRNACGSACAAYESRLARFDSFITDIRRGQRVDFTFLRDGVTITSGGQSRKVDGRDFSETALASFIGPRARGDELRDGLLAPPPS